MILARGCACCRGGSAFRDPGRALWMSLESARSRWATRHSTGDIGPASVSALAGASRVSTWSRTRKVCCGRRWPSRSLTRTPELGVRNSTPGHAFHSASPGGHACVESGGPDARVVFGIPPAADMTCNSWKELPPPERPRPCPPRGGCTCQLRRGGSRELYMSIFRGIFPDPGRRLLPVGATGLGT